MNKIFKLGGVAALALGAVSSFAAIDTTAATSGIADAQAATLVVLGAMVTMGAAVFGVKKILRLIGR